MSVPDLESSTLAHCRYHWGAVLLSVAALSWSRPGWTAPPSERANPTAHELFALHYTAPAECPSEQAFIEWTDQFYAGADGPSPNDPEYRWQASPAELSGSIRVQVIQRGSQFAAHLVMVSADGHCSTSRPPHSELDCGDAVRAMAYSLAEALRASPCAEAPTAPTEPVCPRGSAPTPTPRAPACPDEKPCPAPHESVRGEAGLSLGGMGPVAERIAWGGALLAGFRSFQPGGASGRLRVGYWNAGKVPLGYDLRARLWTVAAALCPYEVVLNRRLTLPLCASAEVGTVAISGFGAAAAQDGTSDETLEPLADPGDRANLYLWSALGVAVPLRLQNRWLFAEIEPNLSWPLLRHPVYGHQPGNAASEQQLMGQVAHWAAFKALFTVGVAFP